MELPMQFGPYLLEQELGAGGMGVVYRAIDRRVPRTVALKILHSAMAADPVYRERFRRESALLRDAEHPYIVPLYAAGEIDDRLYLEMRLIDGDDLKTLIDRHGPMPPDKAVQVVDGIADALDFVHSRGVLHRDIKPSNVMLAGPKLFPYLLDFGIARTSDERRLTEAGSIIGSVEYLSPEQFAGNAVDERSDVYALAGVLHACLTGRAPYAEAGAGHLQQVRAHHEAPVPRPGTYDPALAPFDAVIARGMAKRPELRYATAGELATAAHQALDAVQRLAAGTPATTLPAVPLRDRAATAIAPAPPLVRTVAPEPVPQQAPARQAPTDQPAMPGAAVAASLLIVIGALAGLAGALLPWFHALVQAESVSARPPNALSAWGDGRIGAFAPAVLGMAALMAAMWQVLARSFPVAARLDVLVGATAVLAGVAAVVLQYVAWRIVPSHYLFGPSHTWTFGRTWHEAARAAHRLHGALHRGTQPGFAITTGGATLTAFSGAVLIASGILSRREQSGARRRHASAESTSRGRRNAAHR